MKPESSAVARGIAADPLMIRVPSTAPGIALVSGMQNDPVNLR